MDIIREYRRLAGLSESKCLGFQTGHVTLGMPSAQDLDSLSTKQPSHPDIPNVQGAKPQPISISKKAQRLSSRFTARRKKAARGSR